MTSDNDTRQEHAELAVYAVCFAAFISIVSALYRWRINRQCTRLRRPPLHCLECLLLAADNACGQGGQWLLGRMCRDVTMIVAKPCAGQHAKPAALRQRQHPCRLTRTALPGRQATALLATGQLAWAYIVYRGDAAPAMRFRTRMRPQVQ